MPVATFPRFQRLHFVLQHASVYMYVLGTCIHTSVYMSIHKYIRIQSARAHKSDERASKREHERAREKARVTSRVEARKDAVVGRDRERERGRCRKRERGSYPKYA